MRYAIALFLILALASAATATGLGTRAPVKTIGVDENVPNPVRQGGDTIATATVIPGLPYSDSGTTAGYTDDYAGTCIYDNGAPDVVYSLVVPAGVAGIAVSLCGSSYDTGLYVYDASQTQIACNDDDCGLQSQLYNVPVVAGQTCFIIVDGYGAASGSYVISVEVFAPCVLECPPAGYPEGEPPLVDNYVDVYNGGCDFPPFVFQSLTADEDGEFVLCGVAGWFLANGSPYRDIDYFILTMGAGGAIEVTADAEYATHFFEILPQDCATMAVFQQALGGPCAEASMTITGYAPGAPVWLVALGSTYEDPDGGENEYNYVVYLTGLQPGPIAVEPTTWSTVKALYE